MTHFNADQRPTSLASIEIIDVSSDDEQVHTPAIQHATIKLSSSITVQVILLPRTLSTISCQLTFRTSVGIIKYTVRAKHVNTLE